MLEYYSKTEYSNRLINVFEKLFDECLVCAKENREVVAYYNAYENILQTIIDSSKKLNPDNEKIALFESKLNEIENYNKEVVVG